jgi:hypothetical protein
VHCMPIIADQMKPGNSHTSAIGVHPYYTTLYGRNHAHYTERALMFSILYDDVYLTPADNPWPKSLLSDSQSFHPELGLHADWDEYSPLFGDEDGSVSRYLSEPQLVSILRDKFKIPPGCWTMILSSILYEYCLSRQYLCPILCSPGRRVILDRLIEIDRPAIDPITVPDLNLDAAQAYMGVTGLVLSPTGLDDMSYVKTDPQVRAYASQFLRMLEGFRLDPNETVLPP